MPIDITMNIHIDLLKNPVDSNSSGYTQTILYLSIRYFSVKKINPNGIIIGTHNENKNTRANIEILNACWYTISK